MLFKNLELEPDFNDAFSKLAAVYHKEGKLHELIEVYEAAQVAEENKHIHFSFLAQAYLLDGKKEKAINYINQSISLCPNKNDMKDKRYLSYFIIKGNIYLNSADADNAINCYKEVLKINDKIEQAYVNIGCAYINNKKRPKEGIPYLEKALKLNPKVASIHANLGNAYYMLGDKEKALSYLNEAQRLDPSISSALSSKAADIWIQASLSKLCLH